MASAADLGKKLLAEVEEVGLDEIFNLLRAQDDHFELNFFGVPPLDDLLRNLQEARPKPPTTISTWPIVELMSLSPGGGETRLLHHLCTHAVLPTGYSGRQTCVIVLDPDGTFSIPQLAQSMKDALHQQSETLAEVVLDDVVSTALKHVHIFHPQTLLSTTATIDSLPDYLFNEARHGSFDRRVGFIALSSASTFYWQDRAEVEDATFTASTTGKRVKPPATTSGYTALVTSLQEAAKSFSCPVIYTSAYFGPIPTQQQHRSYRSPISALSSSRLVMQRVPIRKFPANISLDLALREAADRRKAVREGKYICFVNEWGLDERTVQRLSAMPGGTAFDFRISGDSVLVEKK